MNQIVEKSFFKIFLIHFAIFSLFAGFPVSAQVCPSGEICIENPLEADSIEELIENVITFIFWIAVALAPLMVLVGAFYILTSGGDPKRVQTGRDVILYTFVGLLIVFLAKGVIGMIRFVLGG